MDPRFVVSRFFAGLVGFAVVLVLTLPADAARRKGKICKTDHFHYGSSRGHPSKKVARQEAIYSWAGFTAFEYGTAWSNFRLARSRGVRCERSDGAWGCSIEAVPCRSVPRRSRRSR